MRPVTFPDQNFTFTKPENMTDEECSSLPTKRTIQNGYPAMESVWELSDEELAVIAASRRVRLIVLGTSMPPVSVHAEPFAITEGPTATVAKIEKTQNDELNAGNQANGASDELG